MLKSFLFYSNLEVEVLVFPNQKEILVYTQVNWPGENSFKNYKPKVPEYKRENTEVLKNCKKQGGNKLNEMASIDFMLIKDGNGTDFCYCCKNDDKQWLDICYSLEVNKIWRSDFCIGDTWSSSSSPGSMSSILIRCQDLASCGRKTLQSSRKQIASPWSSPSTCFWCTSTVVICLPRKKSLNELDCLSSLE